MKTLLIALLLTCCNYIEVDAKDTTIVLEGTACVPTELTEITKEGEA